MTHSSLMTHIMMTLSFAWMRASDWAGGSGQLTMFIALIFHIWPRPRRAQGEEGEEGR